MKKIISLLGLLTLFFLNTYSQNRGNNDDCDDFTMLIDNVIIKSDTLYLVKGDTMWYDFIFNGYPVSCSGIDPLTKNGEWQTSGAISEYGVYYGATSYNVVWIFETDYHKTYILNEIGDTISPSIDTEVDTMSSIIIPETASLLSLSKGNIINQNITFELYLDENPTSYYIYNQQGVLITQQQNISGSGSELFSIPFLNQPAGMYIISSVHQNTRDTKKLIKR